MQAEKPTAQTSTKAESHVFNSKKFPLLSQQLKPLLIMQQQHSRLHRNRLFLGKNKWTTMQHCPISKIICQADYLYHDLLCILVIRCFVFSLRRRVFQSCFQSFHWFVPNINYPTLIEIHWRKSREDYIKVRTYGLYLPCNSWFQIEAEVMLH